MFLMAMNILLLIIGMFMDIISATLILGPVFLLLLGGPFGVDPMHSGLIMTVNLAIGYCTRPCRVESVHHRIPAKGYYLCVPGHLAVSGHPDRCVVLWTYFPRSFCFALDARIQLTHEKIC